MISTVVTPDTKPLVLFDPVTGPLAYGQRNALRAKVGRQFFEHDTRKNTSTTFGKDSTNPMYGNGNVRSRYQHHAKTIADHLAKVRSESTSPNYFATDNVSFSSTPQCADHTNQKLRRKLLKVQRKLRMQTEALKLQQHQQKLQQHMLMPNTGHGGHGTTKNPKSVGDSSSGGGCCCSCINNMSLVHLQNRSTATTSSASSDVLHCVSQMDPFRVQGMRSVVR